MKSYNLKLNSAAVYGQLAMSVIDDTKRTLLGHIDKQVIPALEQAVAGDDAKRLHNIMSDASTVIYKATGVWYDDIDYYNEFGDNLNGYISLLIHRINEAIG